MKIFEFYFNPRAKKDRVFKSFSSKKQKGLYLIGELNNVIPQNARLLNRLFLLLEKEYLASAKNPRDRMKHALSKANEFLTKESRKGNTDWLGNIHCAALLLSPSRKSPPELFFAKVGAMRIFIGREKRIIDIEQSLGSTFQPHHVKTSGNYVPDHRFGNVVSGRLLAGDKVFVCTKDLLAAFEKEHILKECTEAQNEVQLKTLFQSKQKQLKGTQGMLFSAFMEGSSGKKHLSLFTLPPLPKLPMRISKNTAFLAIFLFLLLGGMIFLRGQQFFLNEEAQAEKQAIEELRQQATSALSAGDERNAFLLFMEARKRASSETLSSRESQSIVQDLEEKLLAISHTESLADPELFADIPVKEIGLIPQHMVRAGEFLYLSNPSSAIIYAIHRKTNERTIIQRSTNSSLSSAMNQSAIFFEEPNTILRITGLSVEERTLQNPYPHFTADALATFEGNIYFWDSKARQIVRYTFSQSPPLQAHLWFNSETTKKPEGTHAPFVIDRNIWIASRNTDIERYFGGLYQETIPQLVFPEIKEISEIYTRSDLPSLYIIEAPAKRVIRISKSGLIQKQYQSPHFDNLLSLTVSSDGKTIYLLNGSRIYAIQE